MLEAVKRCVFCQGPRPPSDPPEHVFPQWISRILQQLPGDGNFHIASSDPDLPSYECSIIALTTNAVCRACNGGWMSDLESVVSPLLSGAITASSTTLPDHHHKTLATWAAKTAMMLDCSYGDLGSRRVIPDAHCHDLYANNAPRHYTMVAATSFGYHPGRQTFRHAWSCRTKIEGIRLSTGTRFDSYFVTFQYGYFVVQVVVLDTEQHPPATFSGADLRLPGGQVVPGPDFIRQIWPRLGKAIAWPPPVGLDAAALDVWGRIGPFVIEQG